MARPTKQGLDYYPKDVKAKYDTKFKYIESKNTVLARLVIYELWDLIYGEEGYYTKFDNIQRVLFLGELPFITEEQLTNILESCFEINMFEKSLYERYEILTSVSIQKRYMEAVGRRTKVNIIENYFLLDRKSYRNIFLVNVDSNSVNVSNNSKNDDSNEQSKVKESKVKESKEKKSNNTKTTANLSEIFQFYENNGFGTISPKTIQDFEYWAKDFIEIGATEKDAINLIIHAMGIAVDYNKRSYAYVNKVLIDWEQKRFLNVNQVEASKKKRQINNRDNKSTHIESNSEVDY